jgi:hypothetical protein
MFCAVVEAMFAISPAPRTVKASATAMKSPMSRRREVPAPHRATRGATAAAARPQTRPKAAMGATACRVTPPRAPKAVLRAGIASSRAPVSGAFTASS